MSLLGFHPVVELYKLDWAIPTLYLERAEDRFGEGNLDAADTAVELAISIIEKKIQEIQEVDGPDSALLVAILCVGGCSLLAQRFRGS